MCSTVEPLPRGPRRLVKPTRRRLVEPTCRRLNKSTCRRLVESTCCFSGLLQRLRRFAKTFPISSFRAQRSKDAESIADRSHAPAWERNPTQASRLHMICSALRACAFLLLAQKKGTKEKGARVSGGCAVPSLLAVRRAARELVLRTRTARAAYPPPWLRGSAAPDGELPPRMSNTGMGAKGHGVP